MARIRSRAVIRCTSVEFLDVYIVAESGLKIQGRIRKIEGGFSAGEEK